MEELTTYDGTVHSIIFQNQENGYTVLRLLTEEGEWSRWWAGSPARRRAST